MPPSAPREVPSVPARLHDPARLDALRRSGLLVGTPDPVFDRLTTLASAVLHVPVALVSIVDADRQVFVGCLGLPDPWAEWRETPLSHSFCQHVVEAGEPLVIEDAREHPLVRDNLAIGDLGVVAYAGMPLRTAEGQVLGSFCVIDARPRRWTADELGILRQLADSAVTEIALRTAQRAAADGAARLEAAMQAAALGAWSYEPAADVRWHSARANELLGEAPAEALMPREAWLARLHPDDRARVAARLEAAAREGARYAVEYRVQPHPDAPPRWVASVGRAVRGADGAVERVVGTMEDVSERVRLEAERRESTDRLRTFVEAVPLFAWINAADGTVESFNRRWYDHTGQDERQARDGRWLDAIHPDDRGRVRAARAEGIARGEPYVVEFRVRGTDGAYRWLAARVEPVRGPDGAASGWVGAALDIDDRRRLEAALRESEARFRTLQDVSPDGSALLAAVRDARGEVADFRVAYINAAATLILTGGDEPLVGRTVREAFPESVAAGRLDVYRRVVETGEPWQQDVAYVRAGVQRGLRVNATRVEDGVHLGFADLTERIAAAAERERLFAETEAARRQLSVILESISSAFLAVDDAWRITYVNAAAERYYARRREDMVGRSVWDVFPLAFPSEHGERLAGAMAARASVEYELLSPTFGRWLRVRADAAADGGLAIFVDDVDERRRAEAWRDGQRRVLEQIASSRPLGEVLASVAALAESQLHGRLVTVLVLDDAGERLRVGAAPSLSATYVRASDGLPIGPDAGTCGRAAATGEQVVTTDIAADPHWAPARELAAAEGLRSCWSRPIAAAGGGVLGTFAVYTRTAGAAPSAAEQRVVDEAADLARIALERARLEGERERALDAERAARATADAANRAKSDFLAVMSHELRTPLNAIGGYAELIEMGVRGPVTAEQRADLARLQKSQRHLLGLINGVLNYAKIDAGAVDYRLADVPLDEVLATCEALVAPQVRARGHALRLDRGPDGLRVRADREKLQQVLLNLLSNAVKFTEPGGRITLDCATAGGGGGRTVRLAVTDTGRGIAPDLLAHVFEPFVQVDTSLTRTQEGTGLGLAISRDLARGMGGDLTAESTPGVGSTFTLTLPLA